MFTDEDTAYVIALAEEERDTCPACGMPKAVCRDPAYQLAFVEHQEQCHASHALARFRASEAWTAKHEDTKAATQVSVRFRDGLSAPLDAGLHLEDLGGDDVEHLAL